MATNKKASYISSYYDRDFNKIKGLVMIFKYKNIKYEVYRPYNGYAIESEKRQHKDKQFMIDRQLQKNNNINNGINAEKELNNFFNIIEGDKKQ